MLGEGTRRRPSSRARSRDSAQTENGHRRKMKMIQDKLDLMEEKGKKNKDKNRDFIKNEGLNFL